MALARSHEVLSAANWKDPELASVAEAVLARESARIHIEGDRLSLEPRVVVAFAQIFHELLVNAERHGALARPDGRVNLSWRREGGKLHLLWVETSSKPSDIEALQGLGTTIIRICIERQLGGVCRFEPEAAGLRFAATIPLHSDLGANAAVIEGPGKAGQGGASHNADLSPRP
jgi:two-component sensor histidine kinase